MSDDDYDDDASKVRARHEGIYEEYVTAPLITRQIEVRGQHHALLALPPRRTPVPME
jgi:hypothetical protein